MVGIDNHKIWRLDQDLGGVMGMEMEVGVMILDEIVNAEEEGGGGIDLNHQRGIGIMDTDVDRSHQDQVLEPDIKIKIKIKINHKKEKGKDHLPHPAQYPRLHLKSIWRVSI